MRERLRKVLLLTVEVVVGLFFASAVGVGAWVVVVVAWPK